MCLTGPSQRVIADLEKPVMVPPEREPAPAPAPEREKVLAGVVEPIDK
jgi:hypothetical protein